MKTCASTLLAVTLLAGCSSGEGDNQVSEPDASNSMRDADTSSLQDAASYVDAPLFDSGSTADAEQSDATASAPPPEAVADAGAPADANPAPDAADAEAGSPVDAQPPSPPQRELVACLTQQGTLTGCNGTAPRSGVGSGVVVSFVNSQGRAVSCSNDDQTTNTVADCATGLMCNVLIYNDTASERLTGTCK